MSDTFEFIDAEYAARTTTNTAAPAPSITQMCAWLQVSRSGSYEWRGRLASATATRRDELTGLVQRSFTVIDTAITLDHLNSDCPDLTGHTTPTRMKNRRKNASMTFTRPRRRSAALVAALLSTVILLAGCGSDDKNDQGDAVGATRTVEADNGTVEIPAHPQRIATLGRLTVSFLDLGGEPVGVTEVDASVLDLLPEEQQAAYNAAKLLGSGASEADLELLASLKPDLILFSAPDSDFEQMKSQLESIAPTIFFGFSSDWKTRLSVTADATELTDALNEQKTEYEEKLAGFQGKYSKIIQDTTFGEVNRGSWQDAGMFTLNGSQCSEIARADIPLDIPDLGEGGEERSFEKIGELSEYDVLLYPVDAEGQVAEGFVPVADSNAWKALPAVTSGKALGVHCFGDVSFTRSYRTYSQYLDSLDKALATLATAG
ncbi:iron complex transport system substrate-binding protein [Frankia sp. Hr75.2]|nr:iron complex transport system substrate-binding protein [Frankia sp. Hr75.2]